MTHTEDLIHIDYTAIMFVYLQVRVAGVEYQPAVASANKKQAKADSAQLALQKLGIVT